MNKEMTARQENKLNMYRATEKHLNDNAAITAAMLAFQTAFNKFKANIVAIAAAAQQKSAAITGITADKRNLKQALSQAAANVAGVVSAYASAISSEKLRQEMNQSFSLLMRTRDDALAPRCQNIHDKAAANLAALADYGIDAAQLAALQTAITDYSSKTMQPRTAISGRKTVGTNLAALFKDSDDILKNQLDKLIEQFRAAHPDFVQTYESARLIIDPPTKPKKPTTAPAKKADDTPKT